MTNREELRRLAEACVLAHEASMRTDSEEAYSAWANLDDEFNSKATPEKVISLIDELDAKDNTLLALTTRHFAESWSRRSTDAKLDEYLSAGIAQLQEERDAAFSQHARDSATLRELCQARDDARKERDAALAALGRAYENYNQVSFASTERGKLIEDLRSELQAAKLLLEQCNEVIAEDGGVYIELRCFLSGEMPAADIIALLGKGNRNG